MNTHNNQNRGEKRIIRRRESSKSPIHIDRFESRGPERVVPNFCVFENLQNHRVLLKFPLISPEKLCCVKNMNQNSSSIKASVNSLELEEHLSLYSIVGQRRAITLLQNISIQYVNDKMEGRKVDPPSVLISGDTGSGRSTIARAFANAILGDPHYKEAIAHTLGMGECLYDYLEKSTSNTVFHIRGGGLSAYSQTVLFRLLKEQVLHIPERTVRKMRTIDFPKPFLIFTTKKDSSLSQELHNAIDWKIELEPYTEEEIFKILQARIRYTLWRVSSDDVLKIIAQNADCNPGRSMKLVQICYSISRSQDRDILEIRDAEKAVELFVKKDPKVGRCCLP